MVEILIMRSSALRYINKLAKEQFNWDRIGPGLFQSEEGHKILLITSNIKSLENFTDNTVLHFGPKWQLTFDISEILALIRGKAFIVGEIFDED